MRYNSGVKVPIVILHGWRKAGKDYSEIKKIFETKGYTVFAPDLPGFGNEHLGKSIMRIDDYVAFVLAYLKKHHISQAILIGHSFGGRVAAKFTSKNPKMVQYLILTGAPLIKQKLSLRKRALSFAAKHVKKGIKFSFEETRMRKVLYYILGEWDYYKASPELKETFKAVIAEDIAPALPSISVPTLIVWGENDTFVPKSIGKQIAERVGKGKYVEIPGATHRLPYESPSLFSQAVLQFITK